MVEVVVVVVVVDGHGHRLAGAVVENLFVQVVGGVVVAVVAVVDVAVCWVPSKVVALISKLDSHAKC